MLTFSQYTNKWLEFHQPNINNLCINDRLHWKPSTADRYQEVTKNYFIPEFGDRYLDQIKKIDIKDYFCRLNKSGLHPNTIKCLFSILRSIFNEACADDIISYNPVQGLSKYLDHNKILPIESSLFFTREELTALLKITAISYNFWYPLLLTASRTGMRLGELIALTWDQINFYRKLIIVDKSYYRGYITSPKSGKTRYIDMSNQLFDELSIWRKKQQELYLDLNEQNGYNLVFCTVKGRRINPNHFREDIWYPILSTGKIRRVVFHGLRHTFCSLLLQQGESPVYVQQQMGHHSIEITIGKYGHLIPGTNHQAVNKLDDYNWNQLALAI